jgi:hypothetical protein
VPESTWYHSRPFWAQNPYLIRFCARKLAWTVQDVRESTSGSAYPCPKARADNVNDTLLVSEEPRHRARKHEYFLLRVPESTNIHPHQRYAMVKQSVRFDALNDSSPNDSYRTAGSCR